MPLTVRVNGSSVGNQIQASWFNDFLNLFTGAMSDQAITFKANVTEQAIGGAPGSVGTLALAAGTDMGIGAYYYVLTFLTADGGETVSSPVSTITTTTGNQDVNLTAIPLGPTGTTSRKLYRTKLGGASTGPFYIDHTFIDNTTTTWLDNHSDSALNTAFMPPAHPAFGGSLIIKDQTGAINFQIFSDGSVGAGKVAVQGSHSLGQPVVSYGNGAPVSLGANEIYFQLT